MSFRTSCPMASSAFQLVRDSLLQSQSLPFSDVLTAQHIEQVFEQEGVSFAREGGCGNEPVYTPAVTLPACGLGKRCISNGVTSTSGRESFIFESRQAGSPSPEKAEWCP